MFFRIKLIAVLILAIGALLYFSRIFFLAPIAHEIENTLRDEVSAAVLSMEAANRSDVLSLRHLVKEIGEDQRIRRALLQDCSSQTEDNMACQERRHTEAMDALSAWYRQHSITNNRNANLPRGERDHISTFPDMPNLIIVALADGTVVARTPGNDTDDWWGDEETGHGVQNLVNHSAFTNTINSGEISDDVIGWLDDPEDTIEEPKMMMVAVSPVITTGGNQDILGAVMLGYRLNDVMANDHHRILGDIHFAYTLDDNITGNSDRTLFSRIQRSEYTDFQTVDGGATESEAASTFSTVMQNPNLHGEVLTAVFTGNSNRHNDHAYLMAKGDFWPHRSSNQRVGFVVAVDMSGHFLSIQFEKTIGLLVLGLIIALLGITLLLFIANQYVNQWVAIDDGLQQVISGNLDYVWRSNRHNILASDVAHSLNIMSAFLQGKPLPDDEQDEDTDTDWFDLLQFADVEVTGSHPAINIKGLAQSAHMTSETSVEEESIQQFYRRLFEEYVTARNEHMEDAEPVPYDRFVAHVKKNANTFKEKHNCTDVRFKVVVKDDKVLLKPIPIK